MMFRLKTEGVDYVVEVQQDGEDVLLRLNGWLAVVLQTNAGTERGAEVVVHGKGLEEMGIRVRVTET